MATMMTQALMLKVKKDQERNWNKSHCSKWASHGELPFENIPDNINNVPIFESMQSSLIIAGKFAHAGYSMVMDNTLVQKLYKVTPLTTLKVPYTEADCSTQIRDFDSRSI